MMRLLKMLGRPFLRVLFAVEHHGLENVPRDGAVILAGNHPSYLDPILVALPIDRTIKFMAWDALFKVPLLGWLIRKLGAFPVDIRKGKGESAFQEACRVLKGGYALGIFPEGQRSEQGPMGELRTGVARLAIETGAPIVPISIGGAVRAWPKWKLLPRPAKIVVRYHKPVIIDEAARTTREHDRSFHQEIMQKVAAGINRSLGPTLREAANIERWYAQPPSHIRTYEWAPLIAAVITSVICWIAGTLEANLIKILIPPAIYYLYLIADLTLIKPGRTTKWVRNSMPVWLAIAWHYPLTQALGVPAGDMNILFLVLVLAAFFAFFYESYFNLQKFVRGLTVSYYLSLALLLQWPHPLGAFITCALFIMIFNIWYRTVYWAVSAVTMAAAIVAALIITRSASYSLLAYTALAFLVVLYVQTLASAAYDIRRASEVSFGNAESFITRRETEVIK
jgi:1-acyl-sn-glycerol-3-phosphate acyltransferase